MKAIINELGLFRSPNFNIWRLNLAGISGVIIGKKLKRLFQQRIIQAFHVIIYVLRMIIHAWCVIIHACCVTIQAFHVIN